MVIYQSLGSVVDGLATKPPRSHLGHQGFIDDLLDPLTTTLVTTSSGPGSGIGDSMIFTTVPLYTMASFMVEYL